MIEDTVWIQIEEFQNQNNFLLYYVKDKDTELKHT